MFGNIGSDPYLSFGGSIEDPFLEKFDDLFEVGRTPDFIDPECAQTFGTAPQPKIPFDMRKRPLEKELREKVFTYLRGLEKVENRTKLVIKFLNDNNYPVDPCDSCKVTKWIHAIIGPKGSSLSSSNVLVESFNLFKKFIKYPLEEKLDRYILEFEKSPNRTMKVIDLLQNEGYDVLKSSTNIKNISGWVKRKIGHPSIFKEIVDTLKKADGLDIKSRHPPIKMDTFDIEVLTQKHKEDFLFFIEKVNFNKKRKLLTIQFLEEMGYTLAMSEKNALKISKWVSDYLSSNKKTKSDKIDPKLKVQSASKRIKTVVT
jgi:hypothetical protein